MISGTYKTSWLGTEIPIHYVTNSGHAVTCLAKLLGTNNTLAIDTETAAYPKYQGSKESGLSPHLSTTRLLQIFDGKEAYVFDLLSIPKTMFAGLLESGKFIGHYSVFDLQYFYKYFGITKCNIGCTHLATKLIYHALYPTDDGLGASLKVLVQSIFKIDLLKEVQTSSWHEPVLTFEQVEYAALDAIAVYFLGEKLAPRIQELGLSRIYKLYKDAQHPIAKMQLNGLKLCVPRHNLVLGTWETAYELALEEVSKVTGLKYITITTIAKYLEGILPKDVLAIWPRTPKGRLQVDADAFADFDYLDIVKPFLALQKYEKLTSSFGKNLIALVNPETGRLHPRFLLAGARTGRLSCSSPNLQQIPRDLEFRRNFIPEDSSTFVCADYSQIELRIAAELSQDKAMLKAYRDGIDLHKLTASKISHKPIDKVTKEERQMAKSFNFGLIYGLGPKKFSHYAKKSYGIEVDTKTATEGVETFRETYPGYRTWQLEQPKFAEKHGFITTPCGKRRSLDKENCFGNAMNTPISGGAAEAMLHALVRTNNTDMKLVNVVHDEILIETKSDTMLYDYADLCDCMIKGYLDVFPNGITKNIVDANTGPSWGDAKG